MTLFTDTKRLLRGSISKPSSLNEIRLSISTLRLSKGGIAGKVEEVVGLEEIVVASVVVGCTLVVPKTTH